MANIKTKEITKLDTWNQKELRKLRMTVNNRISSLKASGKVKELPTGHPLFEMDLGECSSLLKNIQIAEKSLPSSK